MTAELENGAISQLKKLPGNLQDPPYRFKEIHLELTTACNFRCGFCPLTDLQRPAARMDRAMAERVLRECVDEKLTRHATFHLMGEALLHPQCLEILALCRDLGIETRLVTNGSLFREDKFRELFRLVDHLDISYRTVDDMEVQTVQKKLSHQQYLDLVMAAIDLRAAMLDSAATIRLRLFISPKTIPSLRALCLRLDVDPDMVVGPRRERLAAYDVFTLRPWLSFLCEVELDWLGTTKRYPSRFGNCDEFDIGFAVLASGDVTTCCWDAHGGNVMGNVGQDSLRDILFSARAEAFRKAFHRHRCPTETCQKCLGRGSPVRSVVYQALSLVNLR